MLFWNYPPGEKISPHRTDPGKPTMEVMIKKGEKIEKYKANGNIGSGDGEKAGVAYRMKDGSMGYVPEGAATK